MHSFTRSHDRMDASWAETKAVGRELIVAGCDPPTLFDLFEKTSPKQMRSLRSQTVLEAAEFPENIRIGGNQKT